MKKFVAVIMLVFYFLFSTGFVISVHYCMDKVDGVAFGDVTRDECSKCGMSLQDNDGCCKDEVKVMKMQVDQLTAKLAKSGLSLSLPVAATPTFLFTLSSYTAQTVTLSANDPPLSEQDIYLHNRVFRI